MTSAWKKSDWRAKERIQMPDYNDAFALQAVESRLSCYPPLVFAGEARSLKENWHKFPEVKGFFYKVAIVLRVLQNLTLTCCVTPIK